MSIVDAIKAQLPILEKQISGIANALENAPTSIIGLNLPLMLNFPLNGSHDYGKLGENYIYSQRDWLLRLYVFHIESGVPGEAESLVAPYLDPIINFFAARPSLGGIPFVQNARIVSDRGTLIIPYGNGAESDLYIGSEFILRVTTNVPRQFATLE